MNFVTDNPALPSMAWSAYALRGMWMVVLLMLLCRLTTRWTPKRQVIAAALLLLCCALPGAYSPTYWLGLAFMHPSWMTVALSASWLYAHLAGPAQRQPVPHSLLLAQRGLLLLALLGGWILLADMLAWLPITQSIYFLGFSSWAVLLVSVAAVLPWLVWGTQLLQTQPGGVSPLALPLLVLTAFVFTRLPSGNVWDALIDPWLWMVLHGVAIHRMIDVLKRYYSERKHTKQDKP